MNLNIAMHLKEEVWGQIHFMLQDPAGFHVDIVQHLEVTGNQLIINIKMYNESAAEQGRLFQRV